MEDTQIADYMRFAITTAREAGNVLMKNYGKMQELEWTAKQHFRTVVDKMSDDMIRRRIKESFPRHNVYSEENESINQNSQYTWIFDPLDGTIPYRYGTTDHFSVCIALASQKNPILGVVFAPKRGELYHAQKGKGAFCNDKRIHVSLEENINHVLMGLDGGKETGSFKRTDIIPYIEKACSPNGITCFLASGCASVPLVLTASGKLHAYTALSLEPWDMAAAAVINRESGARVTNLEGKEWETDDPSIVVANPALHKKLLELFKG